jgi:hypothetical protein
MIHPHHAIVSAGAYLFASADELPPLELSEQAPLTTFTVISIATDHQRTVKETVKFAGKLQSIYNH